MIYDVLLRVTRRWYFLVFLVVLQFVPPYTERGSVRGEDVGRFIFLVLSKAPAMTFESLFLPLKLLPIGVFVLALILKRRVFRVLAAISFCYFLFLALFQNMAQTEEYGLSIVTSNVFSVALLAFSWMLEAWVHRTHPRLSLRGTHLILLAIALFALWYPVDLPSFRPDFRAGFFSNPAGLFVCMVIPLYLTMLLWAVPEVNFVTLRVTGYVGAILGFWNALNNFLVFPQLLWWNGVLHLPLLGISLYAVFVSFRAEPRAITESGYPSGGR